MEKVREEEEQLKKLYQRHSKKYKPFGFESKFKLSFFLFFFFFLKKEKYPWHFRLLRILLRHSWVPGISAQERMGRELGGAGSGRSRQRRHRASCFPVSPDGEAPKLTKHTDYYPLVESLITLFQGIAALALILFGQVARGALN